MPIYFNGQLVSKMYAGGQEFSGLNFVILPTHTFEITTGNNGYNSALGRGTIDVGTFNTPKAKRATVIHCRRVSNELNFALGGVANEDADFPARIVATKLTGGVVTRTFTKQGGASRRAINGGVRQDYDPSSGSVSDVFVNGQTVRVELYY